MSNKRITDLTELTNPTTDDVFPVVDIASNTTTKVQLGNLPVPTSVTTALATKENTITPGTTAQYFRGDKSFQTLDKTAVGLANVDNTSDANKPVSTAQQTALNAKQDTLVSGTNIKTLNSTSLLGSGNIVLTANPSGVAGAIQFSDGSAFASDAANFFWNNTTKRLGIGTNAPTGKTQITESFTTTGNNYSAITFDGILTSRATASDTIFGFRNTQSIVATALGQTIIANDLTPNYTFFDANTDSIGLRIGGLKNTQNNSTAILMQQTASAGNNGLAIQPANSRWVIGFCDAQLNQIARARIVYGRAGIRIGINSNDPATGLFEIQGSGSTSATTSLLVQNSAGTAALQVKDNGDVGNTPASGVSWLLNNVGLALSSGGVIDVAGPGSSNTRLNSGASGNAAVGTTTNHAFSFLTNNSAKGQISSTGQWLIGAYSTSYNVCANLEIRSTTQGVLFPRVTTTQKNAISTPLAGLVVFDTTLGKLSVHNGTAWEAITSV